MSINSKNIIIAPSILSGDFGNLAEEAKRVESAGADLLHLDVMDGHFVNNITFGPQVVAAINRSTDLFLDVHLMMYRPFDYVERFIEAGADQITFHIEATEEVDQVIEYVHRCNVKVGIALCPETSESLILKYLDKIDLLLLMTVNPGFGGQAFIPEVLDKIRFIRETCDRLDIRQGGVVEKDSELPPFNIQVDGGINFNTAKQCVDSGANVLVSGTYLFNSDDMSHSIQALRSGVE